MQSTMSATDRVISSAITLFVIAIAGSLAIDAGWPNYPILAIVIWASWLLGVWAGRA